MRSASTPDEEDQDEVKPDEQEAVSKLHCFYCFDILHHSIKNKLNYYDEDSTKNPEPRFSNANQSFPLFVTWNTLPSQSKASRFVGTSPSSPRLRGCIGTFEPQPLKQGLAEYAIISGLKDRRFSPITEKELPRLQCVVSLLTNFETCSDYLDWEIGTHGIYLTLPNPSLAPSLNNSNSETSSNSSSSASSGNSTPNKPPPPTKSKKSSSQTFLTATYLPEVASAQGWTQVEAIDSAIRKSGYNGKISEDIRRGIRLKRYRSELCHVDYKEWEQWREDIGMEI